MALSNIFIICWIAFMGLMSFLIKPFKTELVLGNVKIRTGWLFAIFVFAPIVFMATYRGDVADTYAYRKAFQTMPVTLKGLSEYMQTVPKDKGFSWLSGLIKCLIHDNELLYFFIIALFQGYALVSLYRKYSSNYVFSIFLFVASTDIYSWMFNGMRQFVAVAIIICATSFYLQKKWIPAIISIIFASTMHQSALLMILIVIIAQGKAWNVRTIIFLCCALIAVVYVDSFTNILDDMMQETQYSNMVTDWKLWGDNGTNSLRVLVYSLPALLSLVGLKYIYEIDDQVIHFCTNMSIVTCGLYLVSMVTSGVFMGRLPIYASLYSYILLPWEIDNIFDKKSAQFVKVCAIAGYLGFYFYQLVIAW